MLRAAVKEQSPVGLKADYYMSRGELLPDEIMIDIILVRLQQPDCIGQGWLLDGFPRTGNQAGALLKAGL
jgi:adenylate kinase